jgi:hypothetical protein
MVEVCALKLIVIAFVPAATLGTIHTEAVNPVPVTVLTGEPYVLPLSSAMVTVGELALAHETNSPTQLPALVGSSYWVMYL